MDVLVGQQLGGHNGTMKIKADGTSRDVELRPVMTIYVNSLWKTSLGAGSKHLLRFVQLITIWLSI